MRSKLERFKEWRGKQYKKEKVFIQTANLFSDYVDSTKNLSKIQNDFKDHPSAQFNALNIHKKLAFGMLTYGKLHIEECLEQLPKGSKESALLIELAFVFQEGYVNYTKNAAQNVESLFDLTNKLLDLYPNETTNIKQAKALSYSLYTILTIVNVFLNNLNWAKRAIANRLIDLDGTLQKLSDLLIKTENTVQQLELADKSEETTSTQVYKTAQEYFNHQYLIPLNNEELSEEKKLTQLENNIDSVVNSISALIDERNKKEAIESKIKAVKALLKTAKTNETRVSGRKYFLDLVHDHNNDLQILLVNNSAKKDIFLKNYDRLTAPSAVQYISSNILYAASWGSALLTVPFRYITPQGIQNTIKAQLPTTLDSVTKSSLIDLAEECLITLKKELTTVNQGIESVQKDMFNNDEKLVPLITSQSKDQLEELLHSNQEAKKAVIKYSTLADSIKNKSEVVKQLMQHYNTLDNFIKTHDGFLVALSNFFARLSSIFKTQTASLIDNSRAMIQDLTKLETEYQQFINEKTRVIADELPIEQPIRNKLKQELASGLSNQPRKRQTNLSKQDISLLISELGQLFSASQSSKTQISDKVQISIQNSA